MTKHEPSPAGAPEGWEPFSAPDTFYPSCLRPCLGGYVHVHTNTRYQIGRAHV